MVKFGFDHDNPLDRMKGESSKANTALRDYAYMGEARSLSKLIEHYQKISENDIDQNDELAVSDQNRPQSAPKAPPDIPTLRVKTLKTWSITFLWQERIACWKAIEDELKWIERRRQIREDEWGHGSKLFELAGQILEEGPNFIREKRKFDKETGIETIIVALDINALVRVSEIATKLRRQAAGLETERVKVDDWRSEIVEMLKKKQVSPEQIKQDFGDDADELLRAAGISTSA